MGNIILSAVVVIIIAPNGIVNYDLMYLQKIEMWYYLVFLNEINRFKNYLFDKKYYNLFCKKYWWDKKRRYYDNIIYSTFNKDISKFLKER